MELGWGHLLEAEGKQACGERAAKLVVAHVEELKVAQAAVAAVALVGRGVRGWEHRGGDRACEAVGLEGEADDGACRVVGSVAVDDTGRAHARVGGLHGAYEIRHLQLAVAMGGGLRGGARGDGGGGNRIVEGRGGEAAAAAASRGAIAAERCGLVDITREAREIERAADDAIPAVDAGLAFEPVRLVDPLLAAREVVQVDEGHDHVGRWQRRRRRRRRRRGRWRWPGQFWR